jgi:hypothetical protein
VKLEREGKPMAEWDHPTLTLEEFAKRRMELLAEESGAPASWWYLSFVDPERPEGTRWLGALIVKASGFLSAIEGTHLMNLNPGGEVAADEIPYTDAEAEPWAYRLLTREDVGRLPEPEQPMA